MKSKLGLALGVVIALTGPAVFAQSPLPSDVLAYSQVRAGMTGSGRTGSLAAAAYPPPTIGMTVSTGFSRIDRLPPYVFNEVNELKMAARRRGEDRGLEPRLSRCSWPERRQAPTP